MVKLVDDLKDLTEKIKQGTFDTVHVFGGRWGAGLGNIATLCR